MTTTLRKTLVAAASVLLLTGCGALADDTAGSVPDGSYLVANELIFDPVQHDVEDQSVCNGLPGEEVLERFDRADAAELNLAPGEALMTCGHADGAGWRHIADGHTDDFGEIAELVDSSWEDVAWFVIDRALERPSDVVLYREDIANFIVLLEYVGESGDVEQQWEIVVGVGLTSDKIITSFPRNPR
ncbi:MAG TPA: hypothetical protein H9830_12690 [Candidatus Agrococcus pullicola]|uniref:Lipoprotein n=1 Tax=Candidatus Agrococcus pullicola TaxID=2838429 RepID=A0A9D1YWI7_9MICO|nr:hypothetical protein [Candidatus Agrococcus pullicola]